MGMTSDSFGHAHSHSRSSHNRQRASSRLAPFPLPRIPSDSVVSDHTSDAIQDKIHGQHANNDELFQANAVSATPSLDTAGDLLHKSMNQFDTAYSPPAIAYETPVPQDATRPTLVLLDLTARWPLIHGIVTDPESRRIFYFMLLNLAFMVVQSTYGYLTGSLGLISDSIHMFFDCVALFVGLCAAVMSKWPPSLKFPYGYGKIDTLAGLGNGVFLMLISVEIVYEAIERLFSGADVARTTELLIVSTLGLIVNCVGIMAFHGHHGHDHGHGHGHEHEHEHGHSHSDSHSKDDHDHAHSHDHCHTHDHHDHKHDHHHDSKVKNALPSASASPTKGNKAASGAHSHGENMQGIYLHILADALGSVSVVVSTLLIQFTGWSGWDPIASFMIAVLIFASTVPLVSSTTKILLLSLNSDIEYNLRDILAGVSNIRGVVGYSVPKFWLEDIKKEPGHHGHSHGHDHHHGHGHTHGHQRKTSDGHSHEHGKGDEDPTVLGVMHVIAGSTADLNDVESRVGAYLRARKMDVVVQVEREGESRCWCGGGKAS